MSGPEGMLALAQRHRFTVLLVALSLLFVVSPTLRILIGPSDSASARGILTFMFLVALLAAANAVSQTRRGLIIGTVLVLLVTLMQGVESVARNDGLLIVHHLLAIGFLAHVSFHVLAHVFRAQRVRTDTVSAAICLYLLAGLGWSLIFCIVEIAEPGSFSASFATAAEPFRMRVSGVNSADAFYFSFVTLTTLGFGDIVPSTPAARLLVVAEALMGQLYLAVLVARVVGLQVAGHLSDKPS